VNERGDKPAMSKVLVLDDDTVNRKLLAAVLHHRGHSVIEASDGNAGLALACAERPDLIISDIMMPTMDGFEFVRQLRARAEVAHTKVIFYTAYYHEREACDLAVACGVSRVLMKSSGTREIQQTVDEVLAGCYSRT